MSHFTHNGKVRAIMGEAPHAMAANLVCYALALINFS